MKQADDYAALLFALGPVQDFISTARRGQDFWFGSWLLSDLSRHAASEARELGAELILPDPEALRPEVAVANKIVARVPAANAEQVARAMEKAIGRRLAELAEAVFKRICEKGGADLLLRSPAETQIADLPEMYWVTVKEVASWSETRKRAETALAARKSLRDFAPVTWGAAAPKSQLDGNRESVIHESAFERQTEAHAERLRQIFGAGPAERLCGVGLLKRNGRYALSQEDARGSRVLSTAHVASWSLRRAWHDQTGLHPELKHAFEAFQQALPRKGSAISLVPNGGADPVLGRYDGLVLFKSQLDELYEGDERKQANQALLTFLSSARAIIEGADRHWPVLSPYYAVVRADGDRVGSWLNGLSQHKDHRSASAVLGEFAKGAESIVASHHGHCIFAGGDDVLALLPMATALDCAAELNKRFGEIVEAAPKGKNDYPTLSVGVQIAHATEPFRDSLEGAKKAEHAAKLAYGRAAFSIQLEKRNGPPLVIGGKWERLRLLRELQRHQGHATGTIPRGLAYDLRNVAINLQGDAPELASIRRLEIERVLRQKALALVATKAICERLGPDDIDHTVLQQLCDELLVTRALAGLDGEGA